jgi:hypothetical protein
VNPLSLLETAADGRKVACHLYANPGVSFSGSTKLQWSIIVKTSLAEAIFHNHELDSGFAGVTNFKEAWFFVVIPESRNQPMADPCPDNYGLISSWFM